MLSYFLKSKTKTKTRKKRPNGCQDKKNRRICPVCNSKK